MKIELMLYIYLFICVAMILFNIVTAFVLNRKDKKTDRVSKDFKAEVMVQLTKIKLGEPCELQHKKYLRKKLKKVGNMIAFDKMLEEVYIDDANTVKEYLSQLDSVFIELTVSYCGKDTVETAYFPYIIKKYRLIAYRAFPSIEETLLSLLDEPSIYCRENTMQALYTTGDSDCIMKALKIIDKSDLFYHGKMLSDGLLNFTGSAKELNSKIISEFDNFSVEMRVNLLNFLRLSTGDYCEFTCSLLCDESQNDEIRYACIRYLGKYHYDKAYETLCFLSNISNSDKWQYAAIASSALATYPCENTVNLLKNNLYSFNWYVRSNSAESLERMGITYEQLADVIDGEDRYASEILRYRLQKNNL